MIKRYKRYERRNGRYCSQLFTIVSIVYTCCPIIVLVTDTLANGSILQESKILENPFLEKSENYENLLKL